MGVPVSDPVADPAEGSEPAPERGLVRHVVSMVGGAVGTVIAASFVIFIALSFAPGDPVALLLGGRATDEARAAKRAELGLDDPLVVRYLHWLADAVRGDFGTSLTFRQDVSSLISSRLQTTMILVGLSLVLVLVAGLGLGALGGGSERWRPFVNVITGVGIAIPGFVSASVLIGVFAVKLGWFPTVGAGEGVIDRVWHLTLPAIALSIGYAATVAHLTSAAIREEANRDHVTASHGRGLPPSLVFRRHTLRNAALPVMTFSGLAAAGLVAGAVVVEQAFGIEGIGSLLVKSVSSKDHPVVLAISLIIVVIFVAVTTAIDIVQVLLDPRQRDGS